MKIDAILEEQSKANDFFEIFNTFYASKINHLPDDCVNLQICA